VFLNTFAYTLNNFAIGIIFCLWWPPSFTLWLHLAFSPLPSPLASFGALAHPLVSNIFITFQYFHHCCWCWQLLLPWAKVNQSSWLHQLVVLSIGWVGWFTFFHPPLYLTLTSILSQSIFWVADLWSLLFCYQFFPNLDLHTTHPPSYPIDLNLNPTYKPTYYFEKDFDYLENVCAKQMEQRNWMTTLRKKIWRLQSSRWWNVRWCHVLNNALFILKQKEKKWPS